MSRDGCFTIAQISDLHCGEAHFVPNLLERAISEVNDLEPDVVVVSGAVMGAGATRRLSAVRWGVAGNIVGAWVLTLPAAGAVAALCYWPVQGIF